MIAGNSAAEGDWTPARHGARWTAHRQTFIARAAPVNVTPVEKPVKIEFADRTP